MELPWELWEHHIIPHVQLTGWCALRETASCFAPVVARYLRPWGLVRGSPHPLRKQYRIEYNNARVRVRTALYELLQHGHVPLLCWLCDRGWPMAWVVFYPKTRHDAELFTCLYDKRASRDWARRHFVDSVRDLFWAMVFQSSWLDVDYSYYGLSVCHQQTAGQRDSDDARWTWFRRVNILNCAAARGKSYKLMKPHVDVRLRQVAKEAGYSPPSRQ
jgi:hypothetical protein